MRLTASPFDPVTGQLLPAYRDAYLRGDLTAQHTAAVDAYLRRHRDPADDILRRLHEMKHTGEQIRPRGWVQRQLELVRTAPARLRRRAAGLVAGAALLGGAAWAGAEHPASLPATPEAVAAAPEASRRFVTLQGRVLDENGRPLVGATVLDRLSGRGVGTDAKGYYTLQVPAGRSTRLQYAYAGYYEEELPLDRRFTSNVTLLPRPDAPAAKKHRRWLFF